MAFVTCHGEAATEGVIHESIHFPGGYTPSVAFGDSSRTSPKAKLRRRALMVSFDHFIWEIIDFEYFIDTQKRYDLNKPPSQTSP